MNPFKITPQAAAQAQRLAQFHDEARTQARLLRTQAIDDFWRGANAVLRRTCASTYASARRSAQRLGHALARQWFVAGREVSAATAWLEISVTAGTNSPHEKASFIAAAFAELQAQLGAGEGLEPASYVIVRELPAADWGYGGQTQQARQLARRQAA